MTSRVPVHILEAVASIDQSRLPGKLASGPHECEASRFHSPRPLITNCFAIEGERLVRANPNKPPPPPKFWLCGICADNIILALELLRAYDGELPWEVRREFGNTVRELAVTVWTVLSDADNGKRATAITV